LLNGRGYSELMTEIETKYKAEGIRIKVK
jgi:hypothetical protein